MKLNFDQVNFYSPSSLVQAFGVIPGLTLAKLRAWWRGLQQEEKERICELDSLEIMTELAQLVNKARYICTLNQNYKKKDLMNKKACTDINGETLAHIFELNLSEKGILAENFAKLFSCFNMFITNEKKSRELQENPNKSSLKSFISIKRDKLDCILDLLFEVISDFSEGDKLVFQKQHIVELFPFFSNYSSQNMIFVLDLKPDLKIFFDKLTAFSMLLERQIYLAYFEKVTSHLNPHDLNDNHKSSMTLLNKFNEGQKNYLGQFSSSVGMYDGFFLGDLQISFGETDILFMEDDDEEDSLDGHEQIKLVPKLEIQEIDKLSTTSTRDFEDCTTNDDSFDRISTDSVFKPCSVVMSQPRQYPPQVFNIDYETCPKYIQVNPINFMTVPNPHLKAFPQYNISNGLLIQKGISFESFPSQDSEANSFRTQNNQSFFPVLINEHNTVISHPVSTFKNFNQEKVKSHPKPTLPPRFQKKKERMSRN